MLNIGSHHKNGNYRGKGVLSMKYVDVDRIVSVYIPTVDNYFHC